MIFNTKLPAKQFYMILLPIVAVILLSSLEALVYIKDSFAFRRWMESIGNVHQGLSDDELFNIYVSGNISLYFQKIIIPIGISIHSYFAFIKIRINKLFVFIWVILLAGSIAYSINGSMEWTTTLIISVALQVFVIFVVMSLLSVIENNEKQ